nr:MAG TPA: hypothetical protein [Bacteriophage sp.]
MSLNVGYLRFILSLLLLKNSIQIQYIHSLASSSHSMLSHCML